MRMRGGFLGILVLTATVLAVGTSGAFAAGSPTSATYRCNGTTAGGQSWAIRQSNTNCAFARFAIRTAIDKRRSPKAWRCYIDQSGEFGPERRDYRVRCYRGNRRVLGLAR